STPGWSPAGGAEPGRPSQAAWAVGTRSADLACRSLERVAVGQPVVQRALAPPLRVVLVAAVVVAAGRVVPAGLLVVPGPVVHLPVDRAAPVHVRAEEQPGEALRLQLLAPADLLRASRALEIGRASCRACGEP